MKFEKCSSTSVKVQHSKEKVQLIEEFHRPIRKKSSLRRTIIKVAHDLLHSDLAQLDLLAKNSKNFKFILIVIDCFSKLVWAKPLQTKTGNEINRAF